MEKNRNKRLKIKHSVRKIKYFKIAYKGLKKHLKQNKYKNIKRIKLEN